MERISPISPGEILSTEFMEHTGLTPAELAAVLGVPQGCVVEILKGHKTVTTAIAMRLSDYFKTTSNFWLNLQRNFDAELVIFARETNGRAVY